MKESFPAALLSGMRKPRRLWIPWIPIALYLGHAALYGTWIVDDAGITFAYARNLAEGHGLVSQPGATPVEGYSNPAWMLLMALCFRVGVFDPVWTPKVLSALLVCAGMVLWFRPVVARDPKSPRVATIALGLLALNPAFVIWTVSGLENGMLAIGVAALFLLVSRALARRAGERDACLAAVIALAVTLTRPEGVVWSVAWPAAWWWGLQVRREAKTVRPALAYAATYGLGLASFLLWRYDTFGDLLPNTYYAKATGRSGDAILAGAGVLSTLILVRWFGHVLRRRNPASDWRIVAGLAAALAVAVPLLGGKDVFRAATGWLHAPVAGLYLGLWAAVLRPSAASRAAVLCGGVGAFVLFALPKDWMAEYRFATGVLPFVFLGGASLMCDAAAGQLRIPLSKTWRWTISAGAVVAVLVNFAVRALEFRAAPTVPLAALALEHAGTVERYREVLGGTNVSLLTPDVGAPCCWGNCAFTI